MCGVSQTGNIVITEKDAGEEISEDAIFAWLLAFAQSAEVVEVMGNQNYTGEG